jgi:hypothetical protein
MAQPLRHGTGVSMAVAATMQQQCGNDVWLRTLAAWFDAVAATSGALSRSAWRQTDITERRHRLTREVKQAASYIAQ